MKLKELRLYGFKSFPNKTVLELSRGMTALVGPNGCGKSNVLDSIRWVLGEQRLSQVRCSKNDELVFSGSARLPEQGYADVSLVMENEGEFIELPSEIELRRRFYRSGESSFWINREECRLKEIEAILRGGAAGGRLYSVFDASKLAGIVGGDIHNLLESAAGVLGFRERRHESARKLDLVRRDLVRVEDILAERRRIVRSLSRQRRRAELYAELKQIIVSLEAQKMKARYGMLVKEIEENSQIISEKETQERKLLLDIDKIRKTLKAHDEDLARLLTVQRESREILDRTNARLSEIAAGLSAARTRSQALTENLTRIEEETKQTEQRIKDAFGNIELGNLALKKACEEKESAQKELDEERGKLRADEEELAKHRSLVRSQRDALKELASRLSTVMEERTQARSISQNSQALAETANLELEKLNDRRKTIAGKVTEIKALFKKSDKAIASFQERIKKTESFLSENNRVLEENEGKRREAIELLSRLEGQRNSLQERIETESRQALRRRLGPSYRGLMEELINYPSKLEAVLEAVFYDILGFAAASKMPDLSDLSIKGQAGVVIDREREFKAPKRPSDSKFISWLGDEVSFKKGAPNLLKQRIETWVLVDLKDLIQAAQSYPDLSFVTAQGCALRSDGVALLGRPREALADLRRLKELDTGIVSTSKKLSDLGKTLESLRKERDKYTKVLDDARRSYLEERGKKQLLQTEQENLELQLGEADKERDRLRHEAQSKTDEAEAARVKLTQLETKISSLEGERASAESELSNLETALARKEENLREKLTSLNDKLLSVSHAEEQERKAEEKLDQLNTELTKDKGLLNSRNEETRKILKELNTLEDSSAKLDQEQKKLEEKQAEETARFKEIDTSGIIESKLGLEEELVKRESELDELRRGLIQIRTNLLLSERERDGLASVVSEAASLEEALPIEEVEDRLEDTKRRLTELGPVNEYAAVQYEQENQEYDRIKAQHADITKAAESLNSIISQIDEEARSRFESAFTAVREEFRKTFHYFFPGGEADLKLEAADDPFNSPVQIIGRPEGKQLKRLAQLSDGERAMLGISLLFAFYAVRPAPFLFIDELDAPLDDANVLKFASYLAHLKNDIQVFVITHNKRTMEKADTIYGVTMEEPGVSKIISVRLKDVKRHHVAVEET
ncbi:chromosome segregation protein SMC [candidate division WOR-3 bacterium]|nr:chromosome segregation protein SMC [candidate division WOR-3 bacterium]